MNFSLLASAGAIIVTPDGRRVVLGAIHPFYISAVSGREALWYGPESLWAWDFSASTP